MPTLKAGVAEGRRNVIALCRALFGPALDFSQVEELEEEAAAAAAAAMASSASNIVPAGRGSALYASASRLWQRYQREGAPRQP